MEQYSSGEMVHLEFEVPSIIPEHSANEGKGIFF